MLEIDFRAYEITIFDEVSITGESKSDTVMSLLKKRFSARWDKGGAGGCPSVILAAHNAKGHDFPLLRYSAFNTAEDDQAFLRTFLLFDTVLAIRALVAERNLVPPNAPRGADNSLGLSLAGLAMGDLSRMLTGKKIVDVHTATPDAHAMLPMWAFMTCARSEAAWRAGFVPQVPPGEIEAAAREAACIDDAVQWLLSQPTPLPEIPPLP
jgi:hypothetical protein